MGIRTIEKVKAEALKSPHVDAPTSLKLGDKVTWTNDYGLSFAGLTIIGFVDPKELYGRSVLLDYNCYWFPVSVSSLKKESK